jgi:GT2 family glycosyltransferase
MVSVVVAARNEAPFIERCIRSLLESEWPADRLEVLVVDGMSEDGTADIVRRLAVGDARVRLLENQQRITPVAFNLGVRAARGEIIFILGGHSSVTRDFLARTVRALQEHPQAWCAGGAIETVNTGVVGRGISAAMSTPVGAGNAKFRLGNYKGYVRTVTFCCYWRWVFDRVGLFDEELVRNQDDEFNLRVNLAGGKVYLDSDIRSYYYPRGSLVQLARQYYQYGFWRIRTIQKHRRPAAIRQIVPLALVLACLVLVIAPLAYPPAVWALAVFMGLYGLCLLVGAVQVACKAGLGPAMVAMAAFAIMHFGYGLGSLKGLVWFVLLRRGPANWPEKHPLSR